ALGAPFGDIVAGLESVAPAFGRAETIALRDGLDLDILLVKNPAGANEVLRTLVLEPGEHHVLGVLNDRTADGRDVSWVWDADFCDDCGWGGSTGAPARWGELAAAPPPGVLDVGAGTGRVALDLARQGHEVTALDLDPELLAALRDRADGLPVTTVVGDARS